MKLKDKDIIEINSKLSKLDEQKIKVQKKINKDIPLTRRQSLFLLFFNLFFSCSFYYLSSYFFSIMEQSLELYENVKITTNLFLASWAGASAIASLFIYRVSNSKKNFEKQFQSFYHLMETIAISILGSFVFGFLGGLVYFFVIGLGLALSKNEMEPSLIHNCLFGICAFFFIRFYIKDFSKNVVKNKTEQNILFKDRKKKTESELKKVENEISMIRQRVIDSINNLDELAYFIFFVGDESLKKVSIYRRAIEEKLLKESKYTTFSEYEKESLLNRLNHNKNIIKNE